MNEIKNENEKNKKIMTLQKTWTHSLHALRTKSAVHHFFCLYSDSLGDDYCRRAAISLS